MTDRPTRVDPLARPLRVHRTAQTVWITTPEYEPRARDAGLDDPATVEAWLDFGHGPSEAAPGRAATRIVAIPGGPDRLHVRRSLHGGWLAPLWRGRVAGLARLRAELEVTARLQAAGAPVAGAAFVLARRSGPLWRAVFCTTHVEGAVDAITFLRGDADDATRAAAARSIGSAVRRIHDLGVRHADLHLGNLLVRVGDAGVRAWVIDFDRARLGAALDARRRSRELRRLLRSLRKRDLEAALGDAGREAFHAGYRDPTEGVARG